MRAPRELETSRLILIPPCLEDAQWIFESYAQDSDVTRYLTWRPHEKIEDTRNYLARCLSVWEQEEAFPYVIIKKDGNRPIGMIEIRVNDYKADIGYVLARGEWGKGYMPEAANAIAKWALEQAEIYRVWAVCDIDNPQSTRVMEKVGMKREGILRRWIIHPNIGAEPRDCYCYAIVKETNLSGSESG